MRRTVETLEAEIERLKDELVEAEYRRSQMQRCIEAAEDQATAYREALREIADNNHGFFRPAGAIASCALAGKPLPPWENRR